ncbi:hypothetical protein ACFQ3L_03885 [Lacticaseibacillus jixianensis]|uniref:Uncharacterized protein n=1 Tax=Lacticaseibacillus jixianensis TaxID=2486012 RepID=A0ABW4B8P1_9LACO|nr:hypothetical protein [Lacticaseibacillus jixianensis]
MTLTVTMTLTDTETQVQLPDGLGTLLLTDDLERQAPANGVRLATSKQTLIGVDAVPAEADAVIILGVPETVDGIKVRRHFQAVLAAGASKAPTGPAAVKQVIAAEQLVLARLGVHFDAAPAKKRPAKARHRFDKALTARPFHVEHSGSKATVYWTAAKEMTIAPGATLKGDLALNKDGSLSYGTKYGQKLRADNAAAIDGLTTTAPVKLRSVNEVGLFLYFGDTNGWLVLIDDAGHTLDELTRVD